MKRTLIFALSLISINCFAMSSASKIESSVTNVENYVCEEGGYPFSIERKNSDTILFNDGTGEPETLKSQESASGEYYVGINYELSLKNGEGFVVYKENGKKYTHKDCKLKK